VRSILGLDASLEEMSGAGGGAIAGYAAGGPEKKRKKNKKTKHPPYNELELYKEVLKLLKKEGIVI